MSQEGSSMKSVCLLASLTLHSMAATALQALCTAL